MQVVVEGFAFAQEFGREDDVIHAVFLAHGVGISHGNGRFDDHQHLRIHFQHVFDGVFHGRGVEEVVLVVVVGRRGNHDQFRRAVGGILVDGGMEIQFPFALLGFPEEALDLIVLDRTDEIIQLVCFLRRGRNRRHLMMLCKQHRQRQPNVSHSCYCDFHISWF